MIPAGYTGPVVIAFGDPSSEEVAGHHGSAAEYRIGSDGILRLSTSAPPAGLYLKQYFYVHADGHQQLIPNQDDENSLQIFGAVVGATATVEGRPETPLRWAAYIVGVRAERTDWVELRSKATEKVLEEILGTEVSAQ